MKIFIAGGGSGSGVVMRKANQKPVFMKMVEVQAGLGVGIKSFSVISFSVTFVTTPKFCPI